MKSASFNERIGIAPQDYFCDDRHRRPSRARGASRFWNRLGYPGREWHSAGDLTTAKHPTLVWSICLIAN